ncbi:hypothetical protein REPUB_Repub02eG0285900 [Reevesia pubescens]
MGMETNLVITNGDDNSGNIKVELTDGWYSMNAILDVLLSKRLLRENCLWDRNFGSGEQDCAAGLGQFHPLRHPVKLVCF